MTYLVQLVRLARFLSIFVTGSGAAFLILFLQSLELQVLFLIEAGDGMKLNGIPRKDAGSHLNQMIRKRFIKKKRERKSKRKRDERKRSFGGKV